MAETQGQRRGRSRRTRVRRPSPSQHVVPFSAKAAAEYVGLPTGCFTCAPAKRSPTCPMRSMRGTDGCTSITRRAGAALSKTELVEQPARRRHETGVSSTESRRERRVQITSSVAMKMARRCQQPELARIRKTSATSASAPTSTAQRTHYAPKFTPTPSNHFPRCPEFDFTANNALLQPPSANTKVNFTECVTP